MNFTIIFDTSDAKASLVIGYSVNLWSSDQLPKEQLRHYNQNELHKFLTFPSRLCRFSVLLTVKPNINWTNLLKRTYFHVELQIIDFLPNSRFHVNSSTENYQTNKKTNFAQFQLKGEKTIKFNSDTILKKSFYTFYFH